MQTAQATVPYLQNPAAMKKDYVSTGNRSDQKSSFSDTLKKGLSKETQSEVDHTVNKQPNQTQKEPGQETQPETQVESIVVPIVPGFVQTPILLQEAGAETVTSNGDLVAEITVIPEQQGLGQQELAGMTEAAGDGNELLSKQTVISELQPIATNRQAQTGTEQKTTVAETETQQQPAVSTAKVTDAQSNQAGQNMAQQGKSQMEAETADSKASELTQPVDRQDTGISRPAAFEVPQTTQKTSVDMTSLRSGIQNLARTMADHMAAGKTEFEIWLEPANLGKMAIKVAYESGRAMVSIMCTNEKTMELISQNAKQLGNILQQHTGDETVVMIDHPESDYLQQKMNQEQQNGQQQEEQNSKEQQEQNQDPEHESFLQQLRLGLM
ncbi:flagellar hook-length control protein FliK [Clostridiales bacterium]|nr:flagellar hook-length control protein FliK [Clostridiales bacterium]